MNLRDNLYLILETEKEEIDSITNDIKNKELIKENIINEHKNNHYINISKKIDKFHNYFINNIIALFLIIITLLILSIVINLNIFITLILLVITITFFIVYNKDNYVRYKLLQANKNNIINEKVNNFINEDNSIKNIIEEIKQLTLKFDIKSVDYYSVCELISIYNEMDENNYFANIHEEYDEFEVYI